jgi:hypothetical protein
VPLSHQFNHEIVFWIVLAIQIVGLASAWLARRSVGCRGQRRCQWLFFSCLTLVGLGSIASMAVSAGSLLVSAGTLATMILAVVWDFGPGTEIEAA